MRIWACTHVGCLRSRNEDRCRTPEWRTTGENEEWKGAAAQHGGWIIIADGMGGHGAGEIASEVAVETLAQLLPAIHTSTQIVEAIRAANECVHEAMATRSGRPGMGTTIVGALLNGDACTFFNVGDSRAYILRDRTMTMHSIDHTPDPDLSSGARSHALTQSLGGTLTRRHLDPHIETVSITRGDLIVLCSDGLTDSVAEHQIVALLRSGSSNPAAVLTEAALAAGGRDNITVTVLAL